MLKQRSKECAPLVFIRDQFLRLALIVSFVPSVNFSLTNFDTQPFAAILGVICIALTSSRGIPLVIWTLVLPAVSALLIALFSSAPLVGARSFTIYVSPWIFACTAYLAHQRKIKIHRYIVFMLYIWTVVGLIQWLIDPRIFEFIVNARTSHDRGVTSLAPEPSLYGLSIIQMWLTLLLCRPRMAFKNNIIFICAFQILLLTQSTLAILVLFALFFVFLFKNKLAILAVMLSLFVFIAIVLNGVDFEGRFFYLLAGFVVNPAEILYLDGSISERFYHIFLSLKYSVYSGFMPHGFEAFAEVLNLGKEQYDSFWWGEAGNKIMSGIGGALFELGWFSFFYFFAFYFYLFKINNISQFLRLVIGLGVFLVLLNSVTLAAPFFGIMIGLMAALNSNARKLQLMLRTS